MSPIFMAPCVVVCGNAATTYVAPLVHNPHYPFLSTPLGPLYNQHAHPPTFLQGRVYAKKNTSTHIVPYNPNAHNNPNII